MTTDPIELITKIIPKLLNDAADEVRGLASKGDDAAKKRVEELGSNHGAVRVVLEGDDGADVYLVMKDGRFFASEDAPDVKVLMAMALPFEALEVGLDELSDDLAAALPKLQRRLTRVSSARAFALLNHVASEKLLFHQVLTDTPDFDEIRVKIAIGDHLPPEQPTFTVTIDYDTFEELRGGKVKPQAMMSKVQMSGDFSRAMQLGMELMQQLKR